MPWAGDIVFTNTKEHYPSSYSGTVSAAGEEMDRRELPELVEAFLNRYDSSGKSVIPVVIHGGSGADRSMEDIKEIYGGTVEEEPLEIYCSDIPYCRKQVTERLKGL